ncbi:MAG: carboxylate--amine ligase [Candidatus Omnitrophota bacterium]|jgi:carbamoyl-phosphate synthase large subunit|nr:MAG: carboxylate--amine ligase [Candidatus Omnitrophota bacterium]
MKNKKIIVGGSGGTPSLNFIRSLRAAREKFHIIGLTCNKFDLCKAEKYCDKVFLVPAAKQKPYLGVLKRIIKETNPDFMHAQNDEEVFEVSKHRSQLGVKTFLPRHNVIEICQDKFLSAQKWQEAGLKVPKTFLINDRKDLEEAFTKIKGKVWVRAISGAFGKWSLPTEDFNFAVNWIDYYKGWGQFTVAEYLSPDSITWLSIWKDGSLIVAQSRKRLYWEFANRSVSGVTGITGTGLTVRDKNIDKLAQKSIFAVDDKPNGIYGVDFTYDKDGIANPTEINIGRFFTTHQFFTEAGLNMPYIFVKTAFSEKLPKLKRKINPLKPGLVWVRGMDVEPVLTDMKKIKNFEKKLKQTMGKIR